MQLCRLQALMHMWNCEVLTINSHVPYPPEMATRELNQSEYQSPANVAKTTQKYTKCPKILNHSLLAYYISFAPYTCLVCTETILP
jgi:hypothetical protein